VSSYEPAEDPRDDDAWAEDEPAARWPLDPGGLYPRERWRWYRELWQDVCALQVRYRLPVRSGWWQHQLQVEALAALAAWVARYDSWRVG